MKRVVNFCKAHGVAKTAIQLAHAGRKASCHTPNDGAQPLTDEEGRWTALAPSPIPYAPDWPVPEALDRVGMSRIKAEFVAATERAVRIGLDLLELHSGHGYLLNQFFSPLRWRLPRWAFPLAASAFPCWFSGWSTMDGG